MPRSFVGQGVQYCYDTRNVEAFAVQMTLLT